MAIIFRYLCRRLMKSFCKPMFTTYVWPDTCRILCGTKDVMEHKNIRNMNEIYVAKKSVPKMVMIPK